ncbi:MAG TPA: TonB family protein [Candidatus Limnocylindrales bacterium]|nr:TonB family protein [Candidatus Limnocylindrales bacterium]
MTSFVKDPENAAAPAAPGIPAATAAGSPARPQPVALEVPVTVNGARSLEGSDKREPFSEHSQTVLVFGHGAVLRISAQLAPGQLVFLTNEKSKKEVVCVVVKSKTDGNAVGYVELRFTEPAPGFWGMRFPADTILPQGATRPAAPGSVPAASKVTPVAPPLAAKPVVPPAVAVTPVIAAPPAPVSFTPEIPKAPAPPAPAGLAVSLQSAPAAEIAAPSVASSPLFAPVEKKSVLPASTVTPSASGPQSTEELKQQAARLQEQLSSLLFAETPKPAASTPEPVVESSPAPELAQKVLKIAIVAPPPVSSQPVRSVAPPPKPKSSSLDVEEIQIPAWLAPLARESETPAAVQSSSVEAHPSMAVESIMAESADEKIAAEAHEPTPRPEVAIFGGQLLGESSPSADSGSSGSKTAVFLGIAASLLLVAGGVWYSRQPGNAISGLLGGGSSSSQPVASSPAVEPASPAAKPVTHSEVPFAAASASPTPTPAPPLVKPPSPATSAAMKNTPAAPVSRTANPVATPGANPVPRDIPQIEESKKPVLGDVRITKPVIKRGKSSSTTGESELRLEVSANANNEAPLSGLSASHRNEPAAPVPVGGDVKPAKLIKSVQPVYPQMARTQHVSGNVQIDALIDADGNVSAMKVLSGPVLLRDAALQSLKQWKYQPAELDGKPTSMHLTVVLQFRAQ